MEQKCTGNHCLSTANCGVLAFQHTLGGKWKTSILWILSAGPIRFSDLRRRLDGITEAMLTKQLRELEEDGFVHREVFPEVPPHVEYSVTELGRKTIPLLALINQWGHENLLSGDLKINRTGKTETAARPVALPPEE